MVVDAQCHGPYSLGRRLEPLPSEQYAAALLKPPLP
jgi:hypothetical protein